MDRIDDLQKRLDWLGKEIREVKNRLPAHSVKPPIMVELLELEDEYDEILKKLNQPKNSSPLEESSSS